jgi:hypothetical protein
VMLAHVGQNIEHLILQNAQHPAYLPAAPHSARRGSH